MKLATLRALLMQKPATTKEVPFGPDVLVFKVKGKMFALVPYEDPAPSISLKCDPDEAMFLRDIYPSVNPGYHLNKRHWNTVTLDETVPETELLRMVDDSYRLVVKGMKKLTVKNCSIIHDKEMKTQIMSDPNKLCTVNFIKKIGRYPHQNIQP